MKCQVLFSLKNTNNSFALIVKGEDFFCDTAPCKAHIHMKHIEILHK